jgi:hypothetical protein
MTLYIDIDLKLIYRMERINRLRIRLRVERLVGPELGVASELGRVISGYLFLV